MPSKDQFVFFFFNIASVAKLIFVIHICTYHIYIYYIFNDQKNSERIQKELRNLIIFSSCIMQFDIFHFVNISLYLYICVCVFIFLNTFLIYFSHLR